MIRTRQASAHDCHHHHAPSAAGITVVKLLIALAMVAILAALAYPSYRTQLLKSRRSEAHVALSALVLAQERWRTNHPHYTSDLEQLAQPSLTPDGSYQLALAVDEDRPSTHFVASAQATGRQQADTQCTRLHLRVALGSLTHGANNAEGGDSTPDCWNP